MDNGRGSRNIFSFGFFFCATMMISNDVLTHISKSTKGKIEKNLSLLTHLFRHKYAQTYLLLYALVCIYVMPYNVM